MKLLLLALILTLTPAAYAKGYEDFDGFYATRFPNGAGADLQLIARGEGLSVKFLNGWRPIISGRTFPLVCQGARCFAPTPLCTIDVQLLDASHFVFFDCDGRGFTFSRRNITEPSAWKLSQTVDPDGVLHVTASVANKAQDTALYMNCKAPHADVSMGLKVSEVLWRAAAYSLDQEGATLKLVSEANGAAYTADQWTAGEGNFLLRGDYVTAAELSALKAGSIAKMKLSAVKSDGTETELGKLQFSLNGSGNALTNLQKRCLGQNLETGLSLFSVSE